MNQYFRQILIGKGVVSWTLKNLMMTMDMKKEKLQKRLMGRTLSCKKKSSLKASVKLENAGGWLFREEQ
jgi:hypothetical protein